MHALIAILQHHPEFALFLALAIGFWFGGLKFGSFSPLRACTSLAPHTMWPDLSQSTGIVPERRS